MALRILSGIIKVPDNKQDGNTTINFINHTDNKGYLRNKKTIGEIGVSFTTAPAKIVSLRRIKVKSNITSIFGVGMINTSFNIDDVNLTKNSVKVKWNTNKKSRLYEISYMFIGEGATSTMRKFFKKTAKKSTKRKTKSKK